MKQLAFLIFFLPTLLFTQSIKDRVSFFHANDRIVYDFQQSISLIAVTHLNTQKIELLVTTGTKDLLTRNSLSSWLSWYEQGCPNAASQEKITITLIPSITIQTEDPKKVSWLLTLLNLPLSPISTSERKRVGPVPLSVELDLRKPWQPPIIVNSKQLSTPSLAFSATWPPDDSPLANRTLIVYFPSSEQAVQALPYWIESHSSSYHVSVIDSSSIES